MQEAELVVLRVGQDHPRDVALTDVDAPGSQRQEPLELGILLAIESPLSQ